MESIPERGSPILIVDDDPGLLLSIKSVLISAGFPEPALISDSRRVMEIVEAHPFQLALLDLLMPHVTGMELLQQVKEKFPGMECLIITAIDEVDTAVQAMRFGAFDYLVKPLQADKLIITVRNAIERYHLRHCLSLFERGRTSADLRNPEAFRDMVAADEAMFRVFQQAETYAATDYNLVITGETGVGKEVLARIVHRLSPRSNSPFVPVNMGSISKTLFEEEFFGHAKGAYTGAQSERKGFFEEAQGGTLFMDEIAELEKDLQAKLLRVIEEKELYRLGSTKVRNVDVRVISTTNLDILDEVKKGRFRGDLYHRLNVCHIHIPPLRERKKDILPLAYHFLRIHSAKSGKEISSIAPELETALMRYPFPGNVRELENIIATTIIAERGTALTLASAPKGVAFLADSESAVEEWLPLEEMERRHIQRVLRHTGGNRTQAAKILGIGLRTLQRKIKIP
jgi:DNA-binding NtrC family response regulator